MGAEISSFYDVKNESGDEDGDEGCAGVNHEHYDETENGSE